MVSLRRNAQPQAQNRNVVLSAPVCKRGRLPQRTLINMMRASARYSLSGYSIMAAIMLFCTLLFSTPPVFAATTQSNGSQKATLPLTWSCGNPTSGHCYGVNKWGGYNSASTTISLNTSLSGGGTSNDLAAYSFVTTEMWVGVDTSPSYWVEAGVISEYYLTGNTFPSYFWADQRPNGGGFSFHYLASISYDSNVLVSIARNGSSNWNVVLTDSLGSLTGTSTNNNITITDIQVGTELYNNYQTAHEPMTYYTNNKWGNNYQMNDGVGTSIESPVEADWYNEQDTVNSSTGGVWYSCIPGYGC